MSRTPSHPAEPEASETDRPGSDVSGLLALALERVRRWCGGEPAALFLSGSHACGEAVWTTVGARRVTLSDLDLYAVVGSRAERERAEARWRADLGRGSPRLGPSLAGPFEVAFLTPQDLSRMPARPGTLELSRHGRVVAGDPALLARVPRWEPGDVSREEVLLLVENRAFELLAARAAPEASTPLGALVARHAVLKVALDLAGAALLEEGGYPSGSRARVAAARARGVAARLAGGAGGGLAPAGPEPSLEAVWESALAWRSGPVQALEPAAARAEWDAVARAWWAAWSRLAGVSAAPEAVAAARRAASRAPLRRRLRRALDLRPRAAPPPPLAGRLRFATAGTPQHRVNATAALLVHAALAGEETLAPRTREGLAALGAAPREAADWTPAARAAVRAWDRWLLDGQRTAEWP